MMLRLLLYLIKKKISSSFLFGFAIFNHLIYYIVQYKWGDFVFDELKKKLFFAKFRILAEKAYRAGTIMEFDEEIYKKMQNTIIACFPVSFYIKHSNNMFPLGTCYDRSLYMFLALDDAILVRGNNKDLEYNYGKGHGGHGWVEIGDYVYDPSIMLKIRKDVYYQLYGTSDVVRTDKATYLKENKEFVDSVVCTDLNEFKPGGKRRLELGILVIQVKTMAEMINDELLTKELNEYLSLIEYDSEQIQQERNKAIEELLHNNGAIEVISGNKLTK